MRVCKLCPACFSFFHLFVILPIGSINNNSSQVFYKSPLNRLIHYPILCGVKVYFSKRKSSKNKYDLNCFAVFVMRFLFRRFVLHKVCGTVFELKFRCSLSNILILSWKCTMETVGFLLRFTRRTGKSRPYANTNNTCYICRTQSRDYTPRLMDFQS